MVSVESSHGYIFYFKDESKLLESLTMFIVAEQNCCPFFRYNISILPNKKGLALEIAGPKAAKLMIQNFIEE